jgi:hypothetical protein
MSSKREVRAALERLKTGAVTLSAHEYHELLEALEQVFEALVLAPKGSDPVATAVWYNHERRPALARLADALSPQAAESSARALADRQLSDREVLHDLRQSLLDNRTF